MGKKRKKKKKAEATDPKIWHVWGRTVKVHKDKKKYNRKKKHKGESDE